MDHVKCADSVVKLVFTHGFPDEVNKDAYDIDERARLIYRDKEIMEKTRIVSMISRWAVQFDR